MLQHCSFSPFPCCCQQEFPCLHPSCWAVGPRVSLGPGWVTAPPFLCCTAPKPPDPGWLCRFSHCCSGSNTLKCLCPGEAGQRCQCQQSRVAAGSDPALGSGRAAGEAFCAQAGAEAMPAHLPKQGHTNKPAGTPGVDTLWTLVPVAPGETEAGAAQHRLFPGEMGMVGMSQHGASMSPGAGTEGKFPFVLPVRGENKIIKS